MALFSLPLGNHTQARQFFTWETYWSVSPISDMMLCVVVDGRCSFFSLVGCRSLLVAHVHTIKRVHLSNQNNEIYARIRRRWQRQQVQYLYACTHIYCTNLRAMGQQLLGLAHTHCFFLLWIFSACHTKYSERKSKGENPRTHTQLVYKAKHIA